MKNIVAVNTNTYHGFSVDEALEGIAAAGFRYVELAAVRGWTEHIMPDMEEADLSRIQNKMKGLGLECIAVSGHCNLTDSERLNDFRNNMKLAKRFGAKYIISSTGEAHFGKDEAFTDEVLINNMKTLVPDLKSNGLILGVEVHGEYGTGEAVYRITKPVGSPLVGVNYDTANVVFYGGKVPNEEIKTCMEGLKFVHLKDKVGMDSSWNFPAIGKGNLDLAGFIKFVAENGYDGPFSIEIEYTQEFTMRDKVPGDINIANQAMKDSYAYLKRIGIL
jgi:sugar phosphate isomerase/epimerase